ncbi:MAG: NAD(+) synthase [Planctomycetaceae bacterium]
MRRIRLGAGILNQTPLDWQGNVRRIVQALTTARQQGVQVLCLPELCLTGYGCEDMFLAPHVWRTAWQLLQDVIPHTRGLLATVGLPLAVGNGVYNAICVAVDGQIAGFVCKRHLAGDGLHYEPRWFRPWPAGQRSGYTAAGKEWPIGDLLFDCDGLLIGFEICEDAWAADRPGAEMSRHGVDIILNPSASHFAFGKHEVRQRFVLDGSRAFGCGYVYANLCGNEAGRAIYDGGALLAAGGRLLAAGPRFSFHETAVVSATIDVDVLRTRRAAVHSLPVDLTGRTAGRIICVPETAIFNDAAGPATAADAQSAVDTEITKNCSKEAEFVLAEALGLHDYLRKTRSRGFVVSMSGGADSSACAVLIRAMVERGLQDLGAAGLRQRLSYIPGLANAETAADFMHTLFSGVYQATRNSSRTTREAAAGVTQAVGGRYHEISIDETVETYTQLVQQMIGRPLSWQTDDVALQNIQARSRSPGVWMLANVTGSLLLATSNRSEAAVGYATMDGDTSGGLSPLAGIDKSFLRRWLILMETSGVPGISPLPALRLVNAQQPTAELRPEQSGQTDETDLMPYDVLERIEELAIRDRLSPQEIVSTLQMSGTAQTAEKTIEWVRRFFGLWSGNQWKRERFAPSFHLDDRNLDPRSWCRFPILSGGFAWELQHLHAAENPSTD